MAQFQGEHSYHIDDKGRIRLPSDISLALGESFTLTKGHHSDPAATRGPIWAVPDAEWQRMVERLQAGRLVNHTSQVLRRWFLGSAATTSLDSQNRLTIPAKLREYAGIQSEVVAVGIGTRLELWAGEVWNEYEAGVNGPMIESYAAKIDL